MGTLGLVRHLVDWFVGLDLTFPSGTVGMPKQKTHKGVKKRFRLTATGKVMHRSAGTSHLASRMSKKRRRRLRGCVAVDTVECRKLAAALGKYSY